MEREDQLTKFVDHIVEGGSAHVEEVIGRFGVSEATAHRDRDALAERQLVNRTRDGAMANNTSGDRPLGYGTVRQSQEKKAIGLSASGRTPKNSDAGRLLDCSSRSW